MTLLIDVSQPLHYKGPDKGGKKNGTMNLKFSRFAVKAGTVTFSVSMVVQE